MFITIVTKCYYTCDLYYIREQMLLYLWPSLHLWPVITFVPSNVRRPARWRVSDKFARPRTFSHFEGIKIYYCVKEGLQYPMIAIKYARAKRGSWNRPHNSEENEGRVCTFLTRANFKKIIKNSKYTLFGWILACEFLFCCSKQ